MDVKEYPKEEDTTQRQLEITQAMETLAGITSG